MKTFFLSIVLACSAWALTAQNEALVTHYQVAPILVNPAYAGFKGTHQLFFNARTQWIAFPDAPKTVGVQYNGPIGNTFGLGVGVMTESAARLTNFRVRLNYAFRFNLEETVKLSVGFSTEYKQMRLGNNILTQAIYDFDDIINGAVDGRQLFDASFGVFGTFNDRTFVGLSFANLISARLDDIVTSADENTFLNHYVIFAGHRFEFNNNAVSLEPSLMIRQTRDAPFQADVNLKLGFLNDRVMGGISYRSLKSLGFLFGSEVSNSFRLFYTFDMSLQDIQQFSSGAHELTVGIGLNTPDKRARLRNR